MEALVNRKDVLQEILEIENRINVMQRNPIYRKIKYNLNYLKGGRFGSNIVPIPSPYDFDKILKIRRNSFEMRDAVLKYGERQAEFDVQIDDLLNQKAMLQKKLFKSSRF